MAGIEIRKVHVFWSEKGTKTKQSHLTKVKKETEDKRVWGYGQKVEERRQ